MYNGGIHVIAIVIRDSWKASVSERENDTHAEHAEKSSSGKYKK